MRILCALIFFVAGCSQWSDPISSCRRKPALDYIEKQALVLDLAPSIREQVQTSLWLMRQQDPNIERDSAELARIEEVLRPMGASVSLVTEIEQIRNTCLMHCDVHRQLWEHP